MFATANVVRNNFIFTYVIEMTESDEPNTYLFRISLETSPYLSINLFMCGVLMWLCTIFLLEILFKIILNALKRFCKLPVHSYLKQTIVQSPPIINIFVWQSLFSIKLCWPELNRFQFFVIYLFVYQLNLTLVFPSYFQRIDSE